MPKWEVSKMWHDHRQRLHDHHNKKHTDEHGRHTPAKSKAALGKVHKVMHEFKHHELHSGSKHGPKVHNRKQAVAIALSEARRGK